MRESEIPSWVSSVSASGLMTEREAAVYRRALNHGDHGTACKILRTAFSRGGNSLWALSSGSPWVRAKVRRLGVRDDFQRDLTEDCTVLDAWKFDPTGRHPSAGVIGGIDVAEEFPGLSVTVDSAWHSRAVRSAAVRVLKDWVGCPDLRSREAVLSGLAGVVLERRLPKTGSDSTVTSLLAAPLALCILRALERGLAGSGSLRGEELAGYISPVLSQAAEVDSDAAEAASLVACSFRERTIPVLSTLDDGDGSSLAAFLSSLEGWVPTETIRLLS